MISPSGEDALVLPAAWRRQLHPRRGGLAVPVAPPDEAAMDRVRAEIAAAGPHIEDVLGHEHSDAALVAAARAHRAGRADPLGAAVVAETVAGCGKGLLPETRVALPDVWVADHGLPFAACAFAACAEVAVDWTKATDDRSVPALRSGGQRARRIPGEEARRLRTLLAAADPDVHAETVARLAEWRRTPDQRMIAAYLDPTRREWVDDVWADPPDPGSGFRWMLHCSLDGPERLDRPGGPELSSLSAHVLGSLLEAAGAAALPLLRDTLDGGKGGDRKDLLTAVALLPTDEAFQTLLDRSDQRYVRSFLLTMVERFPRRAARLLAGAAAGGDERAAELLRAHLLARPGVAEAVLPELPAPARRAVEEATATADGVPEAPPEALPPLLVEPPWTRRRRAARPAVVEGLEPPDERAVVWTPGEREAWAPGAGTARFTGIDWTMEVERYRKEDAPLHWEAFVLTHAPEDLARPLLAEWTRGPASFGDPGEIARILVARFAFDALPVVRGFVAESAVVTGRALLPLRDAEVAGVMADWLVRRKATRSVARAWFGRHGTAAVPFLVPVALGPAGQERRNAEGALRFLAARSGAGAVVAEARPFGEEATAAVEALLSADPLEVLPARMPRLGAWAAPALLPQVLLRDRSTALPATAVGHLLSMMALSKPGEHYPGLAVVRELCDPASLAEFSWAVFETWRAHGLPRRDGWALTQLGALGDDATVRRLAPLLRRWPREGGTTRALAGVDALADIGTQVALLHLHDAAGKGTSVALRARARQRLDQLAAELELTPDRLADRLVPDFGLDAEGGMLLDYGPRRFHVGFDEHLRPHVTTEDGTPRRTLPKPGAKDDPVLAPAAYATFTGLRKDVRGVAETQIRRLEAAMLGRRRWPVEGFRDLLVAHPLVWHLVRRLVWVAEDGDGTTAFRLAEDRSFADVHDDALEPSASARVGVAHPAELGGDLAAWTEVFDDYEITQPFDQLHRPVFTLTDAERDGHRPVRFEGSAVPAPNVWHMRKRGWLPGDAPDGIVRWIFRTLAPDRHVVVDLSPGVPYDSDEDGPDQTVERVRLGTLPVSGASRSAEDVRFGDLDAVTASEVLADLTALTTADH
ncbi:DUF4132 domain-containing protein [Actinomadura kijaniata]|uniref:DUF4132 domain-containing protein n=1 Tax=Actinomadura kijaniata TaxID=46161 RepID=UPI00083344E3|nr:DUF4132 domain-containing protein [Actinomadura kijaniata]